MRISDWSSDVCSSDLLYVIPEPWDGLMRRLKPFPVRRYVFCQNHYYAFHGLADARSYADAGIDTVFCCSEVIAAFLTGTGSEEHTSELQSLMRISYAVFCLKKKTKLTETTNNTNKQT